MHGILKSFIDQENVIWGKHCKIETVFLSRSAEAAKFKKSYIWNTKTSELDYYC